MKHLLVSVSLDSSLEFFGLFADIIILDQGKVPTIARSYETLYIRSHFSQPEAMPQNFRAEIDLIVRQAKAHNPKIRFIDNMNTVDQIIAFEDKWYQYEVLSDFMPQTRLLNDSENPTLQREIFKNRLSSRGSGIIWDRSAIVGPSSEWIAQELLDIIDELRIFVVHAEVNPIGAVRHSMTTEQRTHMSDFRELTQDEITFAQQISRRVPDIDIVGLDVVRTPTGKMHLLEANRSPGFARFARLTNVNLSAILYDEAL